MARLRMLGAAMVLMAIAARGTNAQTTQTPTQGPPFRFEITAAGDSTFSISTGKESSWLRAGQHGIAVDPRRRDALVARFQILSVADGAATALIVGQTAPVTADHVALVVRPAERSAPFYKQKGFWIGITTGAAIGMGIGFRH